MHDEQIKTAGVTDQEGAEEPTADFEPVRSAFAELGIKASVRPAPRAMLSLELLEVGERYALLVECPPGAGLDPNAGGGGGVLVFSDRASRAAVAGALDTLAAPFGETKIGTLRGATAIIRGPAREPCPPELSNVRRSLVAELQRTLYARCVGMLGSEGAIRRACHDAAGSVARLLLNDGAHLTIDVELEERAGDVSSYDATVTLELGGAA